MGPLSERSRDTARRILNAIGALPVGQQYLSVNPFDGLPPRRPSHSAPPGARFSGAITSATGRSAGSSTDDTNARRSVPISPRLDSRAICSA
ncbi:hypothetical protein, partial [Burkholderia stagnalis]|uniref:hypothetical protein n=1 Tax=Burkholderia stagnalis TaxID=1503054 RepID=UPI0018C4AE7A